MADPRAAKLKAVPLFAHCTNTQIQFIVTQVEDMDFPAGRVLWHGRTHRRRLFRPPLRGRGRDAEGPEDREDGDR